jgi:MFS family permease
VPLASHAQKRAASIALAIIVTCQLMVVLDATVVNIALVPIKHSLHFSSAGLSWVIDAYSLAFGGLLLLGGRAGDVFGRRRMLMIGLSIFTGASLFAGLATSGTMLLLMRGVQGVGAALAAPSTLSLISATFEEGPERNRALGIFTAVSAGGGSLGSDPRRSAHVVGFMAIGDVHQRAHRARHHLSWPHASCRNRRAMVDVLTSRAPHWSRVDSRPSSTASFASRNTAPPR